MSKPVKKLIFIGYKKCIIMISVLPSVWIYGKMTYDVIKWRHQFRFPLISQEVFFRSICYCCPNWKIFALTKGKLWQFLYFCIYGCAHCGQIWRHISIFLENWDLVQKNMFTISSYITLFLSDTFCRIKNLFAFRNTGASKLHVFTKI